MGTLRNDFDELNTGSLGDWCFCDNDTQILLRYPDSNNAERGEIISLPVRTKDAPNTEKPCWDWDGNKEAPTLNPSIRVMGGLNGEPDRWHGYLRNGKLETT